MRVGENQHYVSISFTLFLNDVNVCVSVCVSYFTHEKLQGFHCPHLFLEETMAMTAMAMMAMATTMGMEAA